MLVLFPQLEGKRYVLCHHELREAGEMVSQLRAPAAPAEDQGAISGAHTAVHNHLYLQFQGT